MATGPARMVAVVGSRPGVGATSVTLNLAAALVQQGKDVVVLDESVRSSLTDAQREGRLVLINAVLDAEGALSLMAAKANDVLVVLQPTAESITTAYACIKRLQYAHALKPLHLHSHLPLNLHLLVNFAADAGEAQRILANLVNTGNRYLGLVLKPAGFVRGDPNVAQAQRLNLTAVESFQGSPAAADFRQLALNVLQWSRHPQNFGPSAAPATKDLRRAENSILEMN